MVNGLSIEKSTLTRGFNVSSISLTVIVNLTSCRFDNVEDWQTWLFQANALKPKKVKSDPNWNEFRTYPDQDEGGALRCRVYSAHTEVLIQVLHTSSWLNCSTELSSGVDRSEMFSWKCFLECRLGRRLGRFQWILFTDEISRLDVVNIIQQAPSQASKRFSLSHCWWEVKETGDCWWSSTERLGISAFHKPPVGLLISWSFVCLIRKSSDLIKLNWIKTKWIKINQN